MADNASISSTVSSTSVLSFDFNAQDIHSRCPERIVLCIDLASDVQSTKVHSKDKGDIDLLSIWKTALEMFVYNKSKLHSSHEYALVVLTDRANWFCDFNSDPELVCKAISNLQAEATQYDTFDTASLFSLIYENCPPPSLVNLNTPPFVVRAILLYSRSHCLPLFKGDAEAHSELMSSPYFFMDVVYSHDSPAGNNLCKSIFNILSEMYPKPKALVLDWSTNLAKLFNYFAKLIGHPLQRPLQSQMEHRLSAS